MPFAKAAGHSSVQGMSGHRPSSGQLKRPRSRGSRLGQRSAHADLTSSMTITAAFKGGGCQVWFGRAIGRCMRPDALKQAEERLCRARQSLQVLETRGDRSDRESAWLDLITALGTVYSKLEQGSKGNGKSSAWFGRRKNERRVDPLLQYLHQARNAAEHGIARGARYAKQAVSFTGMKPGTMAGLKMTPDGLKPFSTDPDMQLNFVEDDLALMTVRNQGAMFHPPTSHLGAPLKKTGARDVAKLAVEYVDAMVEDARSFVVAEDQT